MSCIAMSKWPVKPFGKAWDLIRAGALDGDARYLAGADNSGERNERRTAS